MCFERKDAFGDRRQYPSAKDPQPGCGSDQTELDCVPVEPHQICQLAELHRSLSTLAVGNHEIRKDRVRQQRHMTKNVVKDVGFLEIVQLFLRSDEGTGWKAPVGEMIEACLSG
jgi:hypothetical protein